jgi:hypothetical protein
MLLTNGWRKIKHGKSFLLPGFYGFHNNVQRVFQCLLPVQVHSVPEKMPEPCGSEM